MPKPTQALALGLIVLFVVVSVPVLIEATTGETAYDAELSEGETQTLTEHVEITADDIPPASNNTTITVRDTQSLDSETQVIADGSNTTYSLTGGNVTVEVTEMTNGSTETVTAQATVPNQYGMSDGARTIASNMGLLLAVVGFIVIVGLLGSVIQ